MRNMDICHEKASIFKFLVESGCCRRCALRFLGDYKANYEDVDSEIKNFVADHEPLQTAKKIKSNSCSTCLDLLQDSFVENLLTSLDIAEIKTYDSDSFVNFISYPMALLLREHSLEIYLEEKFPNWTKGSLKSVKIRSLECYLNILDHQVVPMNRAWSLTVQDKLAKKLNKTFDKGSNLQIQFNVIYELDRQETSVLNALFSRKVKKKSREDALSRTFIGEFLKTIDAKVFRAHVPIPPQPPDFPLVFEDVIYKHEPIFIAGRYCKYSRNIGQTPWIVDDVKIVENSVQDIIFNVIDNVFNCKAMVLSSSGREDLDVRTLGRGRPFFIKVIDAKVTKIDPDKFRDIETKIQDTKLIRVRDLQFISKNSLNLIKEGEQFKRKTYRALCVIDKPENLIDYIYRINETSSIFLKQKTPIRVYHRRSSNTRERQIYNMTARRVTDNDNLFELDLITQAGTYVKEFVHGDLGRTKPSLSDIIGGNVDIVALDVLNIHLDFPPCLNT